MENSVENTPKNEKLFTRFKRSTMLKLFFATLLTLIFAIFPSVSVFAEFGCSDNKDVTFVNVRSSTPHHSNNHSSVTITGYIGSVNNDANSNKYGKPEALHDSISESRFRFYGKDVFADATYDDTYEFQIKKFRLEIGDNNPYQGYYYFEVRGVPSYVNTSLNHYFSACYLEEYTSSSNNSALCASYYFKQNIEKGGNTSDAACLKKRDADILGFTAEDAEEEDKETKETCDEHYGWVGSWTICPLAEGMQKAITGLYGGMIASWLKIEPELFAVDYKTLDGQDFQVTSQNQTDPNDDSWYNHANETSSTAVVEVSSKNKGVVYRNWTKFRDLANIVVVAMLILVILSQISGIGISNYGVKKGLPRILVAGLLINASYLICQVSIDLSNIIGQGLGSLIEFYTIEIGKTAYAQLAGGTVAMVITLVGIIVACIFNPALIVPILGCLLSGIIAVLVLFLTLGARQALAVMLVVLSPAAFACYAVPGLKSLFSKWFNMFKGLLIAYPICSLVVYGAAFGGKILLVTWGADRWYAGIASFALMIVPYYYLPKIIKSSLGSLNVYMTKLQTWANKGAQRRLKESNFAMNRKASAKEKKMRRWSGLKFKKGKFVGGKRGLFWRGGGEFVNDAIQSTQTDKMHEMIKNNPGYIGMADTMADIKAEEKKIEAEHLTGEQMEERYNEAKAQGKTTTMAAYAHQMSKSEEGRIHLDNILRQENTTDEQLDTIALAFGNEEVQALMKTNPYDALYLRRIKNVGARRAGDIDDLKLGDELFDVLTPEDFAKLTEADRERIMQEAFDTVNQPNGWNTTYSVRFEGFMEEVVNNDKLGRVAGHAIPTNNNEVLPLVGSSASSQAMRFINARNTQIQMELDKINKEAETFNGDPDKFFEDKFNNYANGGSLIGMEAAALGFSEWMDGGSNTTASEEVRMSWSRDVVDNVRSWSSGILAPQIHANSSNQYSNAVRLNANLITSRFHGKFD